ncbi:hypothetical protein GWI33_006520 [Rhynchophorus ferrugineus]|uniref:Uncharacterized protein n=1 Tax=Rhynchophorus ferrugineus TaxID=354439 RepID=A0A834MIX1_RHYFE|nr:hypothetical protein GWI33_006520 [Rhynchophorus ferrugineus]
MRVSVAAHYTVSNLYRIGVTPGGKKRRSAADGRWVGVGWRRDGTLARESVDGVRQHETCASDSRREQADEYHLGDNRMSNLCRRIAYPSPYTFFVRGKLSSAGSGQERRNREIRRYGTAHRRSSQEKHSVVRFRVWNSETEIVVNSSTDNVTKMMQRYLLFTASLLLISTTLSQPTTTSSSNATVDSTVNTTLETGQDTVIDLMELKDMTPIEYVGKRLVHMWNELGTEEKGGKSQGFIGRCIGVAKKVKELLPFLMFGGGVIMTKLGFLLLFSLKTVGLLLLLVIFHVGAAALKAGAFFAHKKGHDSPLHVYVEGEHDHGPSHIPVGWDDRRDSLEGHDLYNMYEKLKRENALLKRYYPS